MGNYLGFEINSISRSDKDYPRGLLDISSSPSIIYYKGNIDIINDRKNIAVIGTRKASEKGSKLAYETGQAVAEQGMNLVNGLAIGCDSAAIRGALSKNGKCVAVMPCGLDEIQPKSNYSLAEEILEKGGCLISEYRIGTGIQRYQYVERDRIQSGISQGIIIIEAEEKSGTMHTAQFSLKQHRRLACYYNLLVAHSSGNKLLETKPEVEILKSEEERKNFLRSIVEATEYQQLSLF